MYTIYVRQPILFQSFFVLTVGFRNQDPSMQDVIYFVSHAQTADILTGTWF